MARLSCLVIAWSSYESSRLLLRLPPLWCGLSLEMELLRPALGGEVSNWNSIWRVLSGNSLINKSSYNFRQNHRGKVHLIIVYRDKAAPSIFQATARTKVPLKTMNY
ncbi:uncharacterized protein LOC127240915 [Andrographis paniculata]|uniref:uncharacterized protein LOC127240915 n=1 Tax=Andrographis paniculata TaxID=175694 RepID=UPI0021E8F0D0|nr:uncharacterized protein LOC127240915 [Andrographis paniculata]